MGPASGEVAAFLALAIRARIPVGLLMEVMYPYPTFTGRSRRAPPAGLTAAARDGVLSRTASRQPRATPALSSHLCCRSSREQQNIAWPDGRERSWAHGNRARTPDRGRCNLPGASGTRRGGGGGGESRLPLEVPSPFGSISRSGRCGAGRIQRHGGPRRPLLSAHPDGVRRAGGAAVRGRRAAQFLAVKLRGGGAALHADRVARPAWSSSACSGSGWTSAASTGWPSAINASAARPALSSRGHRVSRASSRQW